MKTEWEKQMEQLEEELNSLPKGTLIYKKIKGNPQPYLQWTENGRSKCYYIKVGEREKILLEIERRRELQSELKRLRKYSEEAAKVISRNPYFGGKAGIGLQNFRDVIERNSLYVDKTHFIREWWEDDTQVTLITRPRRFGKTLTLSMVESFFSTDYAGRSDLFSRLSIWKDRKYRELQGSRPVIFTTFAGIKDRTFAGSIATLSMFLRDLYEEKRYILQGNILREEDKDKFKEIYDGLVRREEAYCVCALRELCQLMNKYHDEPIILLLDEYDTPLQEAYMSGYWESMVSFMRQFFNLSFKTNPYLKKALLTGITKVTKESLFSDLNNLKVVTVTSDQYSDVFGFTEVEVQGILQCRNLDEMAQVKDWYDGYTIGNRQDIYNPWSILNYLNIHQFRPYWVNTASNGLLGKLFLQGNNGMRQDLERLIQGKTIRKVMDENVDFMALEKRPEAIWPLLLAAGYLRADCVIPGEYTECELSIPNRETRFSFQRMIGDWFQTVEPEYNSFCEALIHHDIERMNYFINYVAMDMVSMFDVGVRPSEKAPERFYRGLVLGLMVDLKEQYEVTSNRESGLGRYDIMLKPRKPELDGIIIEFKVRDTSAEPDLHATAQNALAQIEQKQYKAELLKSGLREVQIHTYGFAFEGKKVHIEG